MIFKRLERRRFEEAFGRFLSPAQIDNVMGYLSEWSCFKSTISRWRGEGLHRYVDPAMLAAIVEESKQATEKSKSGH
jgi:hypothetical protein